MIERWNIQIDRLDYEYKMLSLIEMEYIIQWVGNITYTAFVGSDGIYKAMAEMHNI